MEELHQIQFSVRFRYHATIVFSQEIVIEKFVEPNEDCLEMHKA